MYGQIHFDELDDSKDRFTSSREGIVADDPKYSKFLETFRKEILKSLLSGTNCVSNTGKMAIPRIRG